MQSVAACARPDPKLDHDDDLMLSDCLHHCMHACRNTGRDGGQMEIPRGLDRLSSAALLRAFTASPTHPCGPARCVRGVLRHNTYDGGVVYGVQHYHGTHTVRPAGSRVRSGQ
jgi:hypothetical protein